MERCRKCHYLLLFATYSISFYIFVNVKFYVISDDNLVILLVYEFEVGSHLSFFPLLGWGTSGYIPKWLVSNIEYIYIYIKKRRHCNPISFGQSNNAKNWKIVSNFHSCCSRRKVNWKGQSLWPEWEIKGNSRSCVREVPWCFSSHQEIQQYEAWWKAIANWACWNKFGYSCCHASLSK